MRAAPAITAADQVRHVRRPYGQGPFCGNTRAASLVGVTEAAAADKLCKRCLEAIARYRLALFTEPAAMHEIRRRLTRLEADVKRLRRNQS